MTSYFHHIAPIRYEGAASENDLAFKHYDKDRMVLGKRMEDHLRFAACYWHHFVWTGLDPFGGATFERPWFQGDSPMALARLKADAAFEFFKKLGVPFYCFHDRDVAPEGATPRESQDNFHRIVDVLGEKQQATGVKLLWGTANLFSHRRFMSGAASNPDPEIFKRAALQVRDAMDATKQLGGENYVLWGGREGYETLLNTRLRREADQLARFLHLVADGEDPAAAGLGFFGHIAGAYDSDSPRRLAVPRCHCAMLGGGGPPRNGQLPHINGISTPPVRAAFTGVAAPRPGGPNSMSQGGNAAVTRRCSDGFYSDGDWRYDRRHGIGPHRETDRGAAHLPAHGSHAPVVEGHRPRAGPLQAHRRLASGQGAAATGRDRPLRRRDDCQELLVLLLVRSR